MPIYKIILVKDAAKYLARLDKPTQVRIFDTLKKLAQDPTSELLDIKPLIGHDNDYRLRVGNYRILYSLDSEIITIQVFKIAPRGDVYKHL